MRVGLRASQPHYLAHMLPVWQALPAERRGRLEGIGVAPGAEGTTLPRGDVVLAAGVDDLRGEKRPVIWMEHGVGQTYNGVRSNAYAGARDRQGVGLILAPNERVREINHRAHPTIPCEVIGVPYLHEWRWRGLPLRRRPTVAVSFHWDCHLAPETRSARPFYQGVLADLAAEQEWRLVGHGHPRDPLAQRVWEDLRVEYLATWPEVLAEADLYVCDNSSTLYEFAALGRPVVVLNAPWYRREVNHGLRFWDEAYVGLHVNRPEGLVEGVRAALVDPPEIRAQRQEIAERVVPLVEPERASEIVLSYLRRLERTPPPEALEPSRRTTKWRRYPARSGTEPVVDVAWSPGGWTVTYDNRTNRRTEFERVITSGDRHTSVVSVAGYSTATEVLQLGAAELLEVRWRGRVLVTVTADAVDPGLRSAG